MDHPLINPKPMTDKMFLRFSRFIQDELGIKMPEVKKLMLQSRILKRLRKLGINSFEEYHDYVFSPQGLKDELGLMIDVVTTKKTDFFREPKHFNYLVETALPRILGFRTNPYKVQMVVWSAGCSTGEEPYTLAMVLSEFARTQKKFDFKVIGTDISGDALRKARMGIYDSEKAEPIPQVYKKRYLLKSKDKSRRLVRVTPQLRYVVDFRIHNLMEKRFNIRISPDIIFFRNVMIYFSRETQEQVLCNLCRRLKPNGLIFTGHSETLTGLAVPLVSLAPTVYRKK